MFRLVPVTAFLFLCGFSGLKSQDTFSILAFDSITREVGAAGASCVDLSGTPYTDHFIAELFSDTGAVVTQAAYLPVSQSSARTRMRQGDSPQQMMTWLAANIPSPHIRQFGAVRLGYPSAAFTGTGCTDYKGHIVGPNYTIQGNILLGQQVLDSMEARFNRQPGDLACKLMAAMQGAKMQGADTRCHNNNSSSLFAFLKVAMPTDTFGKPSFLVSLRSQMGDSIEPVDSLQKLFDLAHACPQPTITAVAAPASVALQVFPNPAGKRLNILGPAGAAIGIVISDQLGRVVHRVVVNCPHTLEFEAPVPGVYMVTAECDGSPPVRKKVIFRGD